MSQFEKLKEKLKEHYKNDYSSKEADFIYRFMDDFFDNEKNPLNAEIRENNDEENHDSYGNEDSSLNRVFYFPEFDIFVQFLGTRQSHVGEEWHDMREVKPTTKTINTYE